MTLAIDLVTSSNRFHELVAALCHDRLALEAGVRQLLVAAGQAAPDEACKDDDCAVHKMDCLRVSDIVPRMPHDSFFANAQLAKNDDFHAAQSMQLAEAHLSQHLHGDSCCPNGKDARSKSPEGTPVTSKKKKVSIHPASARRSVKWGGDGVASPAPVEDPLSSHTTNGEVASAEARALHARRSVMSSASAFTIFGAYDDMDSLDYSDDVDILGDEGVCSRGVQTEGRRSTSMTKSSSLAGVSKRAGCVLDVAAMRRDLEAALPDPDQATNLHEAVLMGKQRSFLARSLSMQGPAVTTWAQVSRVVRNIVRSKVFDACVNCFVLADFLLLGVDSQARLRPESVPSSLVAFSQGMAAICKVIYFVELCLRLLGFGWRLCCSNPFIRLDAVLVATSIVETVVGYTSNVDAHFLEQLLVVRVLRLVRVARVARVTVQLRTLWLLMSGLAHSLSTMFWTFVLICVVTYLFAVIGMDLIVPENLRVETEADQVAVQRFGSLLAAMLTLLQALTLDSIGQVYTPLITQANTKAAIISGVYFVLYILIVSISLMNLVTAVMVEASMAQAASDAEFLKKMEAERKHRLLPEIMTMFNDLDYDGNAELTMDELYDAPPSLKLRLVQITGTDNPAELFHLLDVDGNGCLKVDEFMYGLLKSVKGAALRDFQLTKILRQTDMLKEMLLDGKTLQEVEELASARTNAKWRKKSHR
eukprot:TRINITY_DN59306_c0_g1_i1.p1 TRINITY_DN59306_c0_g1~~TRINITY_DN59306_c0_g1_i1.p1  ORF type:complete len:703 (-),score=86.47 TRINITY_DN59306_c0_g1_i1:323-2431(-)